MLYGCLPNTGLPEQPAISPSLCKPISSLLPFNETGAFTGPAPWGPWQRTGASFQITFKMRPTQLYKV